jgi:hypothetical protein
LRADVLQGLQVPIAQARRQRFLRCPQQVLQANSGSWCLTCEWVLHSGAADTRMDAARRTGPLLQRMSNIRTAYTCDNAA